MLLAGTVLKFENIKGTKAATADAPAKSWDFNQATVWDGNAAHVCMIGRDFGQPPIEGEVLLAEVEVSPRRNTRSGAWEISVQLVRRADVDALIDAHAPAASRAA